MQLFTSVLAAATSIFVLVSAEEHAGVKPKPRASSRASKPSIIGGDSSVWSPKTHCDSSSSSSSSCRLSSSSTSCPLSSSSSSCPSSSYVSPCSSAWSSSSAYGCDYPCGLACNPLAPAVTPLPPVTPCDPLYGPGYGAYPAGGCGPCGDYPYVDPLLGPGACGPIGCGPIGGCGPAPYPVGDCGAAYAPNMCNPCDRPYPRPCDRKSRGSRRYAEAGCGPVAPWYVYLTATHTSTYSSTSTTYQVATTTLDTVTYSVYTISYTPTDYPPTPIG